MKARFLVTLEIPDGVTPSEMLCYVGEAVSSWCKGTDPEEPLFDLDRDTVSVEYSVEAK